MRISSAMHLIVASAILLVVVVPAQSQELGEPKALQRAFFDTAKRRGDLMRDEKATVTKADDKVAEATAQYYVYRITHDGVLDPAKLQREFETFADEVGKPKTDAARKFGELLAPHLVSCMTQVLDNDIRKYPQLVILSSMMLPSLGKVRQEKTTYYLADLVKNTKIHDAVRLNALKALRESLPISPIDEDTDFEIKGIVGRINVESNAVASLTRFIELPVKTQGMAPQQLAVIRFIRREAIASLAQAGAPAVAAMKKKVVAKSAKRDFQFEAPVAPTLLRVLTDKLEPRPSLQEKLEAAHGVCIFKYPKMPDYNPDVGIFLVGRTLEELVFDYNNDLVNFGGGDKKLPKIGYKTEAKRFQAALAVMADSAKNTPAKAKADKLVTAFMPVFKSMSTYANIDPAKLTEAVKAVSSARPETGEVFRTAKVVIDLK